MVAASKLPIETIREGSSAIKLENFIFGNSVTVTGATYSGDIDSAGTYSNANSVMPGVAPGDTGIILSTGNAQDFTNSSGSSNQSNSTSTNTSDINNNAAGARTYDASILDADFIPEGNLMKL
jgi:hypothetical protein